MIVLCNQIIVDVGLRTTVCRAALLVQKLSDSSRAAEDYHCTIVNLERKDWTVLCSPSRKSGKRSETVRTVKGQLQK